MLAYRCAACTGHGRDHFETSLDRRAAIIKDKFVEQRQPRAIDVVDEIFSSTCVACCKVDRCFDFLSGVHALEDAPFVY